MHGPTLWQLIAPMLLLRRQVWAQHFQERSCVHAWNGLQDLLSTGKCATTHPNEGVLRDVPGHCAEQPLHLNRRVTSTSETPKATECHVKAFGVHWAVARFNFWCQCLQHPLHFGPM